MNRPQIKFKIPALTLCIYCEDESAVAWDHVIPFSKGGETNLKNLVPSCRRCNSIAKDTIFPSFEAKKEYLQAKKLLLKPRPRPKKKPEIQHIEDNERVTFLTFIKNQSIHIKKEKLQAVRTSTPVEAPLIKPGKVKKRNFPKLRSWAWVAYK